MKRGGLMDGTQHALWGSYHASVVENVTVTGTETE